MKRTFVVLTEQRSGSNMLVTSFLDHPEVCCFGEVFRPTDKYRDGPVADYPGALRYLQDLPAAYHDDAYRFAHPGAYLRALWRLEPGFDHYGFKLMLRQHPELADAWIRDPAHHVVLLRRDNALARHASGVKAKLTGEGAAVSAEQIKDVRIPFDREAFLTYLERSNKQWDRVDRVVEAEGKHCLRLEYADILSGEAVDAVLNFLGATIGLDLQTNLIKRNTSVIVDRFEDPDAVRRTLDEIGRPDWAQESPGRVSPPG
ncbi:MAG: hypothetical protein AAF586_04560 [Planctomycetota bacterium]